MLLLRSTTTSEPSFRGIGQGRGSFSCLRKRDRAQPFRMGNDIVQDLEVTQKMYTATVPSGTILDAIFKKSADRAGTNIDLDSGHSRVDDTSLENYWNYVSKPANTVKRKPECPWSHEMCGVSCLRCYAGKQGPDRSHQHPREPRFQAGC